VFLQYEYCTHDWGKQALCPAIPNTDIEQNWWRTKHLNVLVLIELYLLARAAVSSLSGHTHGLGFPEHLLATYSSQPLTSSSHRLQTRYRPVNGCSSAAQQFL